MSVKAKAIIQELNTLAPESLAQDWDNVGLQVGSPNHNISRVLLALDATSRVIDEAIDIKADMIITHHPMIFKPVSNVIQEDPTGSKIYKLIKNNISLYVMHTNFDTAFGGTNDILGAKIGLTKVEVLNPDENGMGIGRVGELAKTSVKELVGSLKKALGLEYVRVIGDLDREIETIGICTGSGMSFMRHAAPRADVFITGDVKFHEAQEAGELGIVVIDVGHYGSENIAMPGIKEYLSKFSAANNIEILISQINEDPFTII